MISQLQNCEFVNLFNYCYLLHVLGSVQGNDDILPYKVRKYVELGVSIKTVSPMPG
jgi:hypothetical protein